VEQQNAFIASDREAIYLDRDLRHRRKRRLALSCRHLPFQPPHDPRTNTNDPHHFEDAVTSLKLHSDGVHDLAVSRGMAQLRGVLPNLGRLVTQNPIHRGSTNPQSAGDLGRRDADFTFRA
jgi:hypothetical protein